MSAAREDGRGVGERGEEEDGGEDAEGGKEKSGLDVFAAA